jgi:hypothetical protein
MARLKKEKINEPSASSHTKNHSRDLAKKAARDSGVLNILIDLNFLYSKMFSPTKENERHYLTTYGRGFMEAILLNHDRFKPFFYSSADRKSTSNILKQFAEDLGNGFSDDKAQKNSTGTPKGPNKGGGGKPKLLFQFDLHGAARRGGGRKKVDKTEWTKGVFSSLDAALATLEGRMAQAMEDECLSPARTVIIFNEISPNFKKLKKNHIPSASLYGGYFLRHLNNIAKSGDVRRTDLTFLPEEHDEEMMNSIRELARSKRAELVPGPAKAGRSLLSLDLDHTLAYTDDHRVIRDGKTVRRQAPMWERLMMGIPEAPADEVDVLDDYDYKLDIDGASGMNKDGELSDGDYQVGGWARSGLAELMVAAHAAFDDVCVYTTATSEYAAAILKQILPGHLMPNFVISRENAIRLPHNRNVRKSALFIEELGYDLKNVVLIDDRNDVYTNSRKNLAIVPAFYGPDINGNTKNDQTLKRLTEVIKKVGGSKNKARDFLKWWSKKDRKTRSTL